MIYIIVLLILLINVANRHRNRITKFSFTMLFSWLSLVLLSGLKYKVGGDLLSYYLRYATYKPITELIGFDFAAAEYQPLWYILNGLCKHFTNEFVLFQLVHAIIVNTVVFWFIYKYSKLPEWTLVFYYIIIYPYFNMEILRESLAVSCFLLSYPFLMSRKYLYYYLLALIGFGFHASAIILFFIPILLKFSQTKNVIRYSCALVTVLIILTFTPFMKNIISYLNFSSMTDRYELYSSLKSNWNGYLLPFLNFCFTTYFIISISKYKPAEDNAILNTYLLILAVSIPIGFFYRILNYLLIPFYIIVFNSFIETKNLRFFESSRKALIILVAFICVNRTYYYTRDMSMYNFGKKAYFYNRYLPYYSVFDPIEDTSRNNIFWGSMNHD